MCSRSSGLLPFCQSDLLKNDFDCLSKYYIYMFSWKYEIQVYTYYSAFFFNQKSFESKPQWDSLSHLLEWLLSKRQLTSVGEDISLLLYLQRDLTLTRTNCLKCVSSLMALCGFQNILWASLMINSACSFSLKVCTLPLLFHDVFVFAFFKNISLFGCVGP